jgi:hypothetical protein
MRSPGCARAPALSTAKLSPAMTTALPRSISSGTTALFLYAFDLIELNDDDLRRGGFECDAHETGGLRIEGLAV